MLPEWQRRGVGTSLLKRVEEIGRENSCIAMDISVVNHRSDLFPVYKKLGYEITGEGPFPDAERVSRPCFFYFMRKMLK